MLIHANAKINWTLDLLGQRADGYHELDTIMQPISLCDTLEISPSSAVSVFANIQLPHNNNIRKAAELYLQAAGIKHGVDIKAEIKIPQQAGLGGSSADAGAVLRALDAMYGQVSEKKLLEIAKTIGADVPFCFKNAAARCRGRGDELFLFPAASGIALLLAKPKAGVNTGELFRGLKSRVNAPADNARAASLLETGDVLRCAEIISNALEQPAIALVPEIGKIICRMKQNGALGAGMTGSGSCCFGVFETMSDASAACKAFFDCAFAATAVTI